MHNLKSLLFSPYPDIPPYVVKTLHPGMAADRENTSGDRRAQENPGGQGEPRKLRRAQESPGAPKRAQKSPEEPRRAQENSRGPRGSYFSSFRSRPMVPPRKGPKNATGGHFYVMSQREEIRGVVFQSPGRGRVQESLREPRKAKESPAELANGGA